jgi:hypothetical protein
MQSVQDRDALGEMIGGLGRRTGTDPSRGEHAQSLARQSPPNLHAQFAELAKLAELAELAELADHVHTPTAEHNIDMKLVARARAGR